MKRFDPSSIRRIVIKLGSSSIIRTDGIVRLGFLGKLVTTIGKLRNEGVEVVLVSSGAIAMGARLLNYEEPPVRISDKQACASTGQMELMTLYQKLFSSLKIQIGQVLLTRDDLQDRRRYLNARDTMFRLFDLGIIPIVNENDSVAVDEIKFGDNDEVSALVAGLVYADLLVLLTDVDGLYDADPQSEPDAKVIEAVEGPIDEFIENSRQSKSTFGTGGMHSKLEAAKLSHNYGIPCIIARAKGGVLQKVLAGNNVGTLIIPTEKKVDGRSRWIAKAAAVGGNIRLDAGAVEAVSSGHKSLLPKGITSIEGDFLRGAVVILSDSDNREIGRGVVRYGSDDLEKIIGKHGTKIESVLGFTFGDEAVHQHDLVLTVWISENNNNE